MRHDIDAAARWLQQALAAPDEHDDDDFAAENHRVMAECLARANGDGAAALEHLHQALAIARAQGGTFFELRAAGAITAQAGDAAPTLDALARLPEPAAWPDVTAARRLADV